MHYLQRGSRGPDVRWVQLRLNLRLRPSPKLTLDGIFGPKTQDALIAYQVQEHLRADGMVTPDTLHALQRLEAPKPAKLPAPPLPMPADLEKFGKELGTLDEFVRHVESLEFDNPSVGALFDRLIRGDGFFHTAGQKRYLLIKGDRVGVVDFRHFFAAAAESYNSGQSRKSNLRLGGSPGATMLLGVANELAQCVEEGWHRQLNSCFSKEDLGTNRLGAGFGEYVKVQEAQGSQVKVSEHLRWYLTIRQPVSPSEARTIKTATTWDQIAEVLLSIWVGVGDFVVPRAY